MLRCHLIDATHCAPVSIRSCALYLIVTFLKRVFDKNVGQIVISDLPFYIPLNYAVNVSSNIL